MAIKYTLLQMTQKILVAMDSDDVNAIDDTEEALEVVDIIEDTYYDLMTQQEWNHLKKPQNMQSLSDADFPSTLKIPDNVIDIGELRYESRTSASDKLNYKTLTYKTPEEFTEFMLKRDSTASNIATKTVKNGGTPLFIKTDEAPKYWTSFDDQYLTMDAYNSSLESTVQGSKSIAYSVVVPVFDSTDGDYVPECAERMFPTLLAESKKACFFYLKKLSSPIDEKRAFRGHSVLRQKRSRAHELKQRVKYGRR